MPNDDDRFSVDADGTVHASLDNIRNISVRHIPELIGHRIMRTADTETHELTFKGGGAAIISYTVEGRITEFRASNMNAEITPENDIILIKTANPHT